MLQVASASPCEASVLGLCSQPQVTSAERLRVVGRACSACVPSHRRCASRVLRAGSSHVDSPGRLRSAAIMTAAAAAAAAATAPAATPAHARAPQSGGPAAPRARPWRPRSPAARPPAPPPAPRA